MNPPPKNKRSFHLKQTDNFHKTNSRNQQNVSSFFIKEKIDTEYTVFLQHFPCFFSESFGYFEKFFILLGKIMKTL